MQIAANRLQWRIGGMLLGAIADRPINRLRQHYGLRPLHESFWLGGASHSLVCLACSPALQPPPPDWPKYVRMTGFCFWDAPAATELSADVQAFLAHPRPLVVVTAGSIGPAMQAAFLPYFQTSVSAIRSVGARAMVIGPADAQDLGAGEDLLALPAAPYSLIFPRAAAIIHHGGIGTTAQALRFGKPSLIVPWGVDQFYSAFQIAHVGAGRFLFWRSYTPQRATAALSAILMDPPYRVSRGGDRGHHRCRKWAGSVVRCVAGAAIAPQVWTCIEGHQ